jgi:hypothetical protein
MQLHIPGLVSEAHRPLSFEVVTTARSFSPVVEPRREVYGPFRYRSPEERAVLASLLLTLEGMLEASEQWVATSPHPIDALELYDGVEGYQSWFVAEAVHEEAYPPYSAVPYETYREHRELRLSMFPRVRPLEGLWALSKFEVVFYDADLQERPVEYHL